MGLAVPSRSLRREVTPPAWAVAARSYTMGQATSKRDMIRLVIVAMRAATCALLINKFEPARLRSSMTSAFHTLVYMDTWKCK